MFKIKFDNSNSFKGKQRWYSAESFDTAVLAESFLLNACYKKQEDGTFLESDDCPLIATIVDMNQGFIEYLSVAPQPDALPISPSDLFSLSGFSGLDEESCWQLAQAMGYEYFSPDGMFYK